MVQYYEQNPEKHPNKILSAKGHETGIEREMRKALSALNVPFQPQLRIGRYFVDFAIPSKMIAIEVDGAYWHKDAAKDQRREADITARGWRVLRFS
jgi:very-short-patch-repair endonuclease